MTTLHLLHTNDFHGKLTPGQAETLRRAKAARSDAILLDAGDAVSAGNVGVRLGGEPILALMAGAGYDAMTLGNREFHVAGNALRLKIGGAGFPLLCANLRWREDRGEPLPTQSSWETTLPGGLRVGIFGLTVPMVTRRMLARWVSAFVFEDPLEEARRQVALLRPQVDALVALTHIGSRQDERLALACPDIDVIVGGHTHDAVDAPKIAGGVAIVQAGSHGKFFGETELTWDAPGERPRVSGRLVPLEGTPPPTSPSTVGGGA